MKKILYFLMPFLCAGLVGCSDDYTPAEGGIEKIESTDLNFTAAGGEGSITVDGFGWISAVSNQEWCEVRVEGMTVHVTVLESQEVTSRSAIVTISAEGESVEVPVVQAGLISDIGALNRIFGYDGGTFTIGTNTDYSIEIPEEVKDWISYSEEVNPESGKTQFVFNVEPSAACRATSLEVRFGSNVYSLNVIQMEATDILGSWDCSYVSGAYEQTLSGPITISVNAGSLRMSELSADLSIPLVLDSDLSLSIIGGQQVGTYYGVYPIVTAVLYGEYVTWSPNAECRASLVYEDGKLVYRFGGNYSDYLGATVENFCLWIQGVSQPLEIYYNFTITKQIQ